QFLAFGPANSVAQYGGSILELKLLADVGAVHFHGLHADIEDIRDLLGALALADKLENLEFAVAGFVDSIDSAVGISPRKGFQDLRAHGRTDINAARQHLAYGLEQSLTIDVLHDVTLGAGLQDTLRVERLIMHRDDQHGHRG